MRPLLNIPQAEESKWKLAIWKTGIDIRAAGCHFKA
jgi:hypothetical protein